MPEAGGSNKEIVLLRRLADGSPDPSFGTGGLVTADFGGDDIGSSAALAPGGKIVMVGTSVVGLASYIVVLRRNADGSQDNTFNGNGRVLLDYGGANDGRAVAVQPDGKIIVAGSANPNGDMAVTRLQVNGHARSDLRHGRDDRDRLRRHGHRLRRAACSLTARSSWAGGRRSAATSSWRA